MSRQHFLIESVDRITGRTFEIGFPGANVDEARDDASAWGFVTGRLISVRSEALLSAGAREIRLSDVVDRGPVFRAWGSGDIGAMLRARDLDCHPVDRHYLLQCTAEIAWKLSNRREDAHHICEEACWQWLVESCVLVAAMQREDDLGVADPLLIRVVAPDLLVAVLESAGDTGRAAEVCRRALELPLSEVNLRNLQDRLDELEPESDV